jgi:hypothetical protein
MKHPLKIIEAEYSELGSKVVNKGKTFVNIRIGLKIQTDQDNYDKDYERLVIEVKSKLNDSLSMIKEDPRPIQVPQKKQFKNPQPAHPNRY